MHLVGMVAQLLAAAVFVGVGIGLTRVSPSTTTRVRALGRAGTVVCGGVAILCVHAAAVHLAETDAVPRSVQKLLLGPVAVILAVGMLAAGIVALIVVLRVWRGLGDSDRMVGTLSSRMPSRPDELVSRLTPRERQVLDLLGSGRLSDQELAADLTISPATVATHIQRMLRKTGLHNRWQLMLVAAALRPSNGSGTGPGRNGGSPASAPDAPLDRLVGSVTPRIAPPRHTAAGPDRPRIR